jgi:hypothetical protein
LDKISEVLRKTLELKKPNGIEKKTPCKTVLFQGF